MLNSLLSVHGPLSSGKQAAESEGKANLVYEVLDTHPALFTVCPDKPVRSRMNLCFRIKGGDDAAEKAFLAGAEKLGLQGLKGHRSVGGIRVSNYNAVPVDNVKKLRGWLDQFVKENQ